MADSIISTFDKGMHQDSTFILQPDGTYRNMKNGMLISYDGNHYTIEMTKGNKVNLSLEPRYLENNNGTASLTDMVPMPIGFASFIDKLVVLSTNNEGDGGYGEIGVITFIKINNDFFGTYVPYYHHKDLKFTKQHKIEAFTFRENDNIERVYWTDNFNEPKVFDIANSQFSTYFTSGTLVTGKQYMVLRGVISHNGLWYGPSDVTLPPGPPNQINGNIFTAVNANYTSVSGGPLVIEYYPLALLDWTPSRSMSNISFYQYGVGSKYCGDSIYFYRLSSSTDGFQTSWSYASSPIHVGMNNETAYLTGVAYRDFVGNGSATTLVNSNKSVKLKITDIDTNFDIIEIACAEFDQVNDVPYSINIVIKLPITGKEMIVEDIGKVSLGTVTISDLTLFPASILKCKTITTNKNYSIIANITEREEFDLDLSGVTLAAFNYPMVEHGDLDLCINGNVPEDQSPDLNVNPLPGDIKPFSRYLVTFGQPTVNTVVYNTVTYLTGEVIVGSSASDTITFTGTGSARPCTTRNRYNNISTSKRVEDAIEIKTGFWDYKDPAVASHNKGYWSGEKYRIGLLFYDKKGNPFYVKYINDIDMPDIYSKGGLMGSALFGSNDMYYINASGIKVNGLDIPESIMDQISGFSIVRAERDARIITQGLLSQNIYDPNVSDMRIYPAGTMRPSLSLIGSYSVANSYYVYLCPDDLVSYPFSKSISDVKTPMEEATWFNGNRFKADVDYHVVYTKMFDSLPPDANSPRSFSIESTNGAGLIRYPVNTGNPNFDGTGISYYNSFIPTVSDFAGNLVTTCSNPIGWSADPILTSGCKKAVLKAFNIPHYGTTQSYSSTSFAASANKLLVNTLSGIDKASQYGGISDIAISNTLYMSTGHFQPINDQVKADTLNGTFTSGPYAGQNKYTFTNMEIFGGDCFTNLIDLGYGLWDDDNNTASNAMSYAIFFPCECNANYNLRRGLKVSNKNMYPVGTMSFNTGGVDYLEGFSYNSGYSTDGNFIKYPGLPLNYKFTGKFEYRIRWAGLKIPGELVNSFRNFRIPDYRDVDGQRGQINNLKSRDSKLFYWQDHSVGYTPILERQLVGGSALGDATALGVTGVIDRYDDIDTYFGNQHQHGLTETEYGFSWFDMRRRAFMVMGIGSKPEEMSMVKGLQVFFNTNFNEGLNSSTDRIYNTNSSIITEKPLMGYGIVGVYDPMFKMTYLTFKYKYFFPLPGDKAENTNRDFTLGYNHILNSFVSFTDNCPAIWHNHNDLVLSANNGKFTKTYDINMPVPTTFEIGDTVMVGNFEYVCIRSFTLTSYPGISTQIPNYPGSVYWTAINSQNQIYLQNFESELCKFYGKVWDHELELVVPFKSDNANTPQNIQVKGLGPNFTSIFCSTDDQTSQDVNISSTSRNYRWIDKAWFSSLPLPKNGRLTDYYVKIKFVYKNYVANPTIAKNIQKVTQFIKTFFIVKR